MAYPSPDRHRLRTGRDYFMENASTAGEFRLKKAEEEHAHVPF